MELRASILKLSPWCKYSTYNNYKLTTYLKPIVKSKIAIMLNCQLMNNVLLLARAAILDNAMLWRLPLLSVDELKTDIINVISPSLYLEMSSVWARYINFYNRQSDQY